ncbi:hypothetical protein [Amycolatopsis thermophila]|uniref:Membrane associated rhomboid family serine protease n=1 Tax=Amycolatopsis thermophila TaxID=206084 RepID=A0ABU0EX40_9PSEU|nr:hypothetical protein [Amycolatopsis thermophila]MDQ0379857.1 membrane associated rhomboid family serine protease [Amycolatopsis thermophila]
MTANTPQRATPNSVSAGPASDVRTFLAAGLLTFAAGELMLLGYALLGVFGGIIGLVGAVFGVVWWRSLHDKKAFPRDLPTKSVVILAVVTAAITLLAFLIVA